MFDGWLMQVADMWFVLDAPPDLKHSSFHCCRGVKSARGIEKQKQPSEVEDAINEVGLFVVS